ncbi:MAG: hypothetical protein MUQ10_19680 [Anaerolineae bacterium]|nr:hypothetical protein [Anaerolineae bacterium]
MSREAPISLAYIVRLWQTRSLRGLTWRASLQDVETSKVAGFCSLEAMFSFLREVVTMPGGLAENAETDLSDDETE